jgi:uncharacterized protein with HEPN domain
MIQSSDLRILSIMVEKTERLMEISKNYSREEIQNNYVLSDAIQYEFEKLYEDSTRLSPEFRINNSGLHFDDLRSIRNRVAHNYESVSISILLDTIEKDIPELNSLLKQFL